MTCLDYRHLVWLATQRHLSLAETASMARHTMRCDDCRDLRDAIVSRAMRTMSPTERHELDCHVAEAYRKIMSDPEINPPGK